MTGNSIELGDLLVSGADRWRGRLIEGCQAGGFPEVSHTTLVALGPLFQEDGLPISEVGERAGVVKSSMTTIVRGLSRDGFVRLEVDPSDHRVTRLYLTPRARDLERAFNEGVTRLRHRVTATLGIQGQQQLHRTLQRLLDTL